MAEKNSIITRLTHPEYAKNAQRWLKYWLAYEGGQDFRDAFLRRYSKREHKRDFEQRKEITYNPGDAQSALNDVRDALLTHLHEVQRTGDKRYITMMDQDVDTFRSSMTTFIGTEILPRLLTQGKVFVFIDSPPQPGDAEPSQLEDQGSTRAIPITRADETQDLPYLWTFTADQCRSWTYNKDGRLTAVLLELWVDTVDPVTGLTDGLTKEFRLIRQLEAGESFGTMQGPGVAVIVFNSLGDEIDAFKLELPRLPVVEFRIAQSLMVDIADMQVGLLNLSSTDMSFLYRGNFPLYTEQYDPSTDIIQATGKKKYTGTAQNKDTNTDLETADGIGSGVGVGTGRRYKKGLNAPTFVAPPTANLDGSMRKQDDISKRIRAACDLALTSLSTAAVKQSGESKKQDRVGLSAGLKYIATQLESAEREIADIVHIYLGTPNAPTTVKYPDEFEMESDEERQSNLDRLTKAREVIRSEVYQKAMTKQMLRTQLRGMVDESVIAAAEKEIDEQDWMDESSSRATAIVNDVKEGLLSKSSGAVLRGHEADEPAKRLAEDAVEADERAFGTEVPPPPPPMDDSEVDDDEDELQAAGD